MATTAAHHWVALMLIASAAGETFKGPATPGIAPTRVHDQADRAAIPSALTHWTTIQQCAGNRRIPRDWALPGNQRGWCPGKSSLQM